jgi:hypothetical protein
MNKIAIFAVCILLLGACSDARHKMTDALDQQVMKVHDEVMPKMGKVLELKKQINQKIDSCATQGCKDSLQKISYMLTKADEDMMQWMRAFERPAGLDTAVQYYKGQMEVVVKVKQEVEQGIAAAEQALGAK